MRDLLEFKNKIINGIEFDSLESGEVKIEICHWDESLSWYLGRSEINQLLSFLQKHVKHFEEKEGEGDE